MSVHRLHPGADPAPAAGDESAAIAAAFLRDHPKPFLLLLTGLAVFVFVLVGGADWLAVFHLMSVKFLDAMGNPVGSKAGLIAMSGVTLIAYVAIGAAWRHPARGMTAAALGLYGIVLMLLGLAIAPAEISNIREVWASVSGSGGGFGASGADEAPSWFVWPCIAALSIAFSLFGIVFLLAKDWLWHLLALWRYRACAAVTLQRFDAAQDAADRRRQLAERIAALESPAVSGALVHAALAQGLGAYRAELGARIVALKTALADVRTAKAEKQLLGDLLAEAGACLKSLSTLNEEHP